MKHATHGPCDAMPVLRRGVIFNSPLPKRTIPSPMGHDEPTRTESIRTGGTRQKNVIGDPDFGVPHYPPIATPFSAGAAVSFAGVKDSPSKQRFSPLTRITHLGQGILRPPVQHAITIFVSHDPLKSTEEVIFLQRRPTARLRVPFP